MGIKEPNNRLSRPASQATCTFKFGPRGQVLLQLVEGGTGKQEGGTGVPGQLISMSWAEVQRGYHCSPASSTVGVCVVQEHWMA